MLLKIICQPCQLYFVPYSFLLSSVHGRTNRAIKRLFSKVTQYSHYLEPTKEQRRINFFTDQFNRSRSSLPMRIIIIIILVLHYYSRPTTQRDRPPTTSIRHTKIAHPPSPLQHGQKTHLAVLPVRRGLGSNAHRDRRLRSRLIGHAQAVGRSGGAETHT